MPRSCCLLVLDSCRYDSFVAAQPEHVLRLGDLQRRYSYASWTSPAHFNLLMGLLPHPSPRHVFASSWYRQDLRDWEARLGLQSVCLTELLPQLWLPSFLQRQGFKTHALVSLPVLNPATPLNTGFDTYAKLERHNDLAAALPTVAEQALQGPCFWLLNTGETHYPYALPDEPEEQWPRLHGVGGAIRTLVDVVPPRQGFDQARLDALRARQIEAVRYLDGVVLRLARALPDDCWLIVTSDHGELFGEDGYFGHGPIEHVKVREVPLVEGPVGRLLGT